MAVKERNPKGGLPDAEDCPSSHNVRIGERGSHRHLTNEQAKKKELSDEAEKKRRAASDAKLATLQENAKSIERFKAQIKTAATAGNTSRVDYLRGELRKARLKNAGAENAVEEHEFERKVQQKAQWSSVPWHCVDCKLSGEMDAVMPNGNVKEAKQNAKPDRDQFRGKYMVAVPQVFSSTTNIHFAVPSGMGDDARTSMASTRDQEFAKTPVQEH